jgi:hypothetical protein
MYIPRPTKLLFTVDDAWNLFLVRFRDNVTPWTRLCVEHMLACGRGATFCRSPMTVAGRRRADAFGGRD